MKNRRLDWTVLAFEAGQSIGQSGAGSYGIQGIEQRDKTIQHNPRSEPAARLPGLDQGMKELD